MYRLTMAMFAEGDRVIVPAVALGLVEDGPALREREVLGVQGRSVVVNTTGDATTTVGTRRVHRDFGLALVRIGDLETESTLLNPMVDSLEQFFRVLLPDDRLWTWRIRTLAEFKKCWSLQHSVVTHVVLVGHGSATSLKFVDQWVAGTALGAALVEAGASDAKEFVSLACYTGRKSFAGGLSTSACCASITGPFGAVHGAVAMQYAQTYFSSLLLGGAAVGTARRHAFQSLPRGNRVRLWKKGSLVKGSESPEPFDADAEAVEE